MPYPKELIEKVINFQCEDMLKATLVHSEIEISGIGLLYVAQGKLKNRLITTERFLNAAIQKNIDSPSPENETKVKYFTNRMEFLKTKLKCQS